MTKKEFLSILNESLAGNVPSDVVNENIRYYKDYIENNEMTESQVLEQLGDPRLIARTIIDSFMAEKGPMADYYTKQAREEYCGSNDDTSSYDDYGTEDGNEYHHLSLKWYDKLLGMIILVVVAMLVIALGAVAIRIFFRIILPLIVIYFIVKIIMERLT